MGGPVRDFGLTEDNELDIQNGDFVKIAGADAVPQGIRTRTKMVKGDCFLNEELGIDYLEQVLIKNFDPLVIRAIFQETILRTPDVTNCIGAQLIEGDNREASIDYQVETVYSDEVLEDQIGVP